MTTENELLAAIFDSTDEEEGNVDDKKDDTNKDATADKKTLIPDTFVKPNLLTDTKKSIGQIEESSSSILTGHTGTNVWSVQPKLQLKNSSDDKNQQTVTTNSNCALTQTSTNVTANTAIPNQNQIRTLPFLSTTISSRRQPLKPNSKQNLKSSLKNLDDKSMSVSDRVSSLLSELEKEIDDQTARNTKNLIQTNGQNQNLIQNQGEQLDQSKQHNLSTAWDSRYPMIEANKQNAASESESTTQGQQKPLDDLIVHDQYLIPTYILKFLRPYQIEGVRWLMSQLLHPVKPIGCIEGDEMGLGKSVMVAVFLGGMYFTTLNQNLKRKVPRATLIVAPPSLLENWRQELRRWGPFDVQIFNGNSENKRRVLERADNGLCQVIIASRGLFSQSSQNQIDFNEDLSTLLTRDWGCTVVDEYHEYKNPLTSLNQNISKLRSRRKLGLTGTPVANKIGEFWALLRGIGEHRSYGTKEEFDARFSNPISEGMRKSTDMLKIATRDKAVREFQEVILKKHFLRRTKVEVKLNLPGKKDRIVGCPLSQTQQKAYTNLLESNDVQAILLGKEGGFKRCVCGLSRQGYDSGCNCNMGLVWQWQHCGIGNLECMPVGSSSTTTGSMSALGIQSSSNIDTSTACRSWNHPWKCHALSLISYLQKISNHLELVHSPFLFADPTTLSPQQRTRQTWEIKFCQLLFKGTELERLFATLGGGKSTNSNSSNMILSSARLGLGSSQHCGKLKMLVQLLNLWRQNINSNSENINSMNSSTVSTLTPNKVLVFSRSTRLLDIIELTLKSQGIRLLRLDGSTPTKLRQTLCTEFNTDPSIFVFIISTRAGGVGLNLTSSNKVIIIDPDWNPCQDLQAQDRSFRIGQTRFVEVFRFLAAGTVEEQVYLRQLYKQQLGRISIDDVKTARRLDKQELEGLERFFILDKSRLTNVIIDDLNADQQGNTNSSKQNQNQMKNSKNNTNSDLDDIDPGSPDYDERQLDKNFDEINQNVEEDQVLKELSQLSQQMDKVESEAEQNRNINNIESEQNLTNIFNGCQQFDHDDCLRRDENEDLLGERAAQAMKRVMYHQQKYSSESDVGTENQNGNGNESDDGITSGKDKNTKESENQNDKNDKESKTIVLSDSDDDHPIKKVKRK